MGSGAFSNNTESTYAQGGEEPAVLAGYVSVLKNLLQHLPGFLALTWLIKGLGRNNTLQSLHLESITCREEMRIVNDLENENN